MMTDAIMNKVVKYALGLTMLSVTCGLIGLPVYEFYGSATLLAVAFVGAMITLLVMGWAVCIRAWQDLS